MSVKTCTAMRMDPVLVWRDGEPQVGGKLLTCALREGHLCEHNGRAPSDGCTSWDDHCPRCAEHECRCRR